MAETLQEFSGTVLTRDGIAYVARACASELPDGLWQGWIEFVPIGAGEPIRSPRETTQPNRTDAEYWASGLTPVYLEGALERALNPLRIARPEPPERPAFSGPAPVSAMAEQGDLTTEAVLDPFSVYEKGEPLLRKQLAALSPWHLVNIITHFGLSDEPRVVLNQLPAAALIDLIISAVREQVEGLRARAR
jgi:hypothetical protein